MGMGALKVLAFDSRAKEVMRRKFGTDVVASNMNEHTFDATIQTDGCIIIGNCAVDDGGKIVETRVSDREIEAVLAGMVAHEGSLVVVEAALFTLMSLAHSPCNAIRQNHLCDIALDKGGSNFFSCWCSRYISHFLKRHSFRTSSQRACHDNSHTHRETKEVQQIAPAALHGAEPLAVGYLISFWFCLGPSLAYFFQNTSNSLGKRSKAQTVPFPTPKLMLRSNFLLLLPTFAHFRVGAVCR